MSGFILRKKCIYQNRLINECARKILGTDFSQSYIYFCGIQKNLRYKKKNVEVNKYLAIQKKSNKSYNQ